MREWKGEWKGEWKREGKLEEINSGVWCGMFGTYARVSGLQGFARQKIRAHHQFITRISEYFLPKTSMILVLILYGYRHFRRSTLDPWRHNTLGGPCLGENSYSRQYGSVILKAKKARMILVLCRRDPPRTDWTAGNFTLCKHAAGARCRERRSAGEVCFNTGYRLEYPE